MVIVPFSVKRRLCIFGKQAPAAANIAEKERVDTPNWNVAFGIPEPSSDRPCMSRSLRVYPRRVEGG